MSDDNDLLFKTTALELKCPACRSSVHFVSAEIFNTALHVKVYSKKIKIDNDREQNPSLYREGLRIHLRCEG